MFGLCYCSTGSSRLADGQARTHTRRTVSHEYYVLIETACYGGNWATEGENWHQNWFFSWRFGSHEYQEKNLSWSWNEWKWDGWTKNVDDHFLRQTPQQRNLGRFTWTLAPPWSVASNCVWILLERSRRALLWGSSCLWWGNLGFQTWTTWCCTEAEQKCCQGAPEVWSGTTAVYSVGVTRCSSGGWHSDRRGASKGVRKRRWTGKTIGGYGGTSRSSHGGVRARGSSSTQLSLQGLTDSDTWQYTEEFTACVGHLVLSSVRQVGNRCGKWESSAIVTGNWHVLQASPCR